MKEENYNGQNNYQSSNQYGNESDRPGSQFQSNNDINIVLKIGPQNQLRQNRVKSPNTLQKEGLNLSQDGISTLHNR